MAHLVAGWKEGSAKLQQLVQAERNPVTLEGNLEELRVQGDRGFWLGLMGNAYRDRVLREIIRLEKSRGQARHDLRNRLAQEARELEGLEARGKQALEALREWLE